VLVMAGALLVSRRLATRRLFGYVDWHLLVLFAGLFVVTASLTATGLPAALLDRLAGQGWRLASLEVLAPLVVVAANTIGNVPLVVLLLGIVAAPSPSSSMPWHCSRRSPAISS
jgi:Na+/H+ antiporter NhaD/arsenite permease-like protein